MWGEPSGLGEGLSGYLGKAGSAPPRPAVLLFQYFAPGHPLYNIHLKQFREGSPEIKLQARWQDQAGGRCLRTGSFATVSVSRPFFYNFYQTIPSPYR